MQSRSTATQQVPAVQSKNRKWTNVEHSIVPQVQLVLTKIIGNENQYKILEEEEDEEVSIKETNHSKKIELDIEMLNVKGSREKV